MDPLTLFRQEALDIITDIYSQELLTDPRELQCGPNESYIGHIVNLNTIKKLLDQDLIPKCPHCQHSFILYRENPAVKAIVEKVIAVVEQYKDKKVHVS